MVHLFLITLLTLLMLLLGMTFMIGYNRIFAVYPRIALMFREMGLKHVHCWKYVNIDERVLK